MDRSWNRDFLKAQGLYFMNTKSKNAFRASKRLNFAKSKKNLKKRKNAKKIVTGPILGNHV